MPTITLNKTVFEKLMGKKLPIEKLKDRISMLGTDLEKIEGDEIVVEIFPNRPDMLSEQGFARAFSSFIGVKTGLRQFKTKSAEKNFEVIIDKSVKNVRPCTACAIVKNLRLDDEKIREIIQIQEKLHTTFGRNRRKAAIGIYPLEDIKLPIRYLAKDPKDIKFTPLESNKEMNGLQILSQHPTGKDYAHLLEGMDKFPIFIDANDNILSMPPIINSHTTGKITEKTKEVFIECSGFDLNTLIKCLNMIVTTLSEMGADIYRMKLVYDSGTIETPNLEPSTMGLDTGYVNKKLGLALKEKDIKELLERMGYAYNKGEVTIPAYRADIMHPVDLIEDIAIAYGYENFEPEIPNVATIGEESAIEVFKTRIANVLIGLGLNELNTYNLTKKENQTSLMNTEMKLIEIANAVNEEYNVLRAWMIPSLLEVLQDNRNHRYPQRVFDTGRIFKHNPKTETKVEENERLCIMSSHESVDFTEMKQTLDFLMNALNLKYDIKETKHSSFIEGRVGRVSINGVNVAYIGEIHPQILENWELNMPVATLELNLTDLFNSMKVE